jgi:hypothetical protein
MNGEGIAHVMKTHNMSEEQAHTYSVKVTEH